VGAEEGRGTPAALCGVLITRGRRSGNVRPTNPMITDTTAYLLVPRGLAHVSKGGIKRFVSGAGTIFRARLHLWRWTKIVKTKNQIAERERE